MRRIIAMLAVVAFLSGCIATQDAFIITPKNADISDNFDLRAVASVFGESNDLSDFERRLNDPALKLSNLDLNQDGVVDYLRIVEAVEGGTHVIVVQAVIGNDIYQDVAVIDVERHDDGYEYVEFIGSVYIYGPDYIIRPVYNTRPVLFEIFWTLDYGVWVSPWYWNYYPSWYYTWRPLPLPVYVPHVHQYIHPRHVYHYPNRRTSIVAPRVHYEVLRNDYSDLHPEKAFPVRYIDIRNKMELDQRRVIETQPQKKVIRKDGGVKTYMKPEVRPAPSKTKTISQPRSSYPKKSSVGNKPVKKSYPK